METKNVELSNKFKALKSSLPSMVLADHFELRPDMAQKYTEHQKYNFQKDVVWILSFLEESVWANDPALFEEFINWLKTFLSSVNVPMKDVAESFDLINNRLKHEFSPAENEIIDLYMSKAKAIVLSQEEKLSIPAMDNQLNQLASNYLDFLLVGKRADALRLVLDEVKSGTQVKEIYLNVFQPVQYEIGRLWQTNNISVAQEHYCTAATQLVMSQLYPYLFTGKKKSSAMVMTCVPGELHEMGARMVTDFFEMQGWDTYYLGANTPIESLISFLTEIKPRFVAISATMTFHVSAVEEMIRKIKASEAIPKDMKIIVGGYPFKVSKDLWKRVGADGFALSADEAIHLAEHLMVA